MLQTVKKGRKAKYPWDQWMDGKEHVVRFGEDFDCQPNSFAMLVRYHARQASRVIEMSVDLEEGRVSFVFKGRR